MFYHLHATATLTVTPKKLFKIFKAPVKLLLPKFQHWAFFVGQKAFLSPSQNVRTLKAWSSM